MGSTSGEVLSGKAIVLDGKHFHNCRYSKCTVIFEGGEWAESNTTFDQCNLSFDGAAARTMALMARFGMIRQIPMPIQPPTAATKPPGALQ
jgi:hypothetical protein